MARGDAGTVDNDVGRHARMIDPAAEYGRRVSRANRGTVPTSKPSPAELENVLAGRVLVAFHVYGINSLKTATPTLESLSGATVSSVEVAPDARTLAIKTSATSIAINLERVGYWLLKPGAKGWSVGDGPAPTARLLLDGCQCLDFSEPSKTKRITIRLGAA
jgi:hypothetical protein